MAVIKRGKLLPAPLELDLGDGSVPMRAMPPYANALQEFFKRKHKVIKSMSCTNDVTSGGTRVTLVCRDLRNGVKEEWIGFLFGAMSFHSTVADWQQVNFRKTQQFDDDAREVFDHDWEKDKDGITRCAKCKRIQGFKQTNCSMTKADFNEEQELIRQRQSTVKLMPGTLIAYDPGKDEDAL